MKFLVIGDVVGASGMNAIKEHVEHCFAKQFAGHSLFLYRPQQPSLSRRPGV